MGAILIKIAQFLLSITILVIVHEFGHFFFARVLKVRVEKFYVFFNPRFTLFKYKAKRTGTEWGIGWLPLGGYCKIAGMIDESMDLDGLGNPPEPYEFRSRPAWQRFLIMFGGILFNFIFALIIYSAIAYAWGSETVQAKDISEGMNFSPAAKEVGFADGDIILQIDGQEAGNVLATNFMRNVVNGKQITVRRNDKDTTLIMPDDLMQRILRDGQGFMGVRVPFVVDSVMKASPAEAAGLRPGDRLLSINSLEAKDRIDAMTILSQEKGKLTSFEFLRAGDTLNIAIPIDTAGFIGVYTSPFDKVYPLKTVSYTPLTAIPEGISQGVGTLTGYVGDMKYIFTKEGASSLGGFGTITNLFPPHWDWTIFWSMTALLSIILAVMNLLPIPVLDGGHIMFVVYEMITRRKVSQQVMIKAQIIGMMIILLLLLIANGNDVIRFFAR